jgi:hypothetical protein
LQELPFLLERFLQTSTSGLQVSPDCLGKLKCAVSPSSSFLLDPFALLGLVADAPSKMATFSHGFETEVLDASFRFCLIVVLCNKNALRMLWAVAPRGTKFLKLLKAEPDLLKVSASPHVVSMPGLMHVRDVFFRIWTRGSSPTPCITVANGPPWVTPSLLRTMRNRLLLPLRITKMAKWRQ